MERVRFEREIFTVIALSREEAEILREACEQHYDREVRALAIPGHGAILNAARVELYDNPDVKEVNIRASARQLDTLVKATETFVQHGLVNVGHALHGKLRELFREAGEERVRSNPESV